MPDRDLPLIVSEFEQLVDENLSRSDFSIHLMGENYGVIPEGATQSVVELQHELAATRSRASEFLRFIWMPPGLETEDIRQQVLIDYLKTDADAQADAEILQVSLEDLKTIVADKLQALQETQAPVDPPEDPPVDDLVRVYLIYDQRDAEAVIPLDDYLYDQGFEVMHPLPDGDEAEIREDHRDNLLLCDAVIIYYGNSDERWLRAKLQDLRKAAGYGRSKPMLAKAIYLGAPETAAKGRYRTREAEVIKHFDGFSADALGPFLAQIEAGKREQGR